MRLANFIPKSVHVSGPLTFVFVILSLIFGFTALFLWALTNKYEIKVLGVLFIIIGIIITFMAISTGSRPRGQVSIRFATIVENNV